MVVNFLLSVMLLDLILLLIFDRNGLGPSDKVDDSLVVPLFLCFRCCLGCLLSRNSDVEKARATIGQNSNELILKVDSEQDADLDSIIVKAVQFMEDDGGG